VGQLQEKLELLLKQKLELIGLLQEVIINQQI